MASQIRVSPNTEGIPLISQGARTPITSAGGSGGAGLGTVRQNTSSSDSGDLDGLLGGLAAAFLGSKLLGGLGGGKPGPNTDPNKQTDSALNPDGSIPVTDPATGLPAGSMTPNTPFNPPGGYPSRDKPTMGVDSATQSIQFPAGTTQADIDKYAPGYQISGVNMSNGSVIATPDLMIGGGNLTGTGSVNFQEKIAPTGRFETVDGNIYTPEGDLYAIKKAGEGFIVKIDNDTWRDSTNYSTYSTDELLPSGGGGYVPGTDIIGPDFSGKSSGIFGTDLSIGPDFTPSLGRSDLYTGGGYDPLSENLADFSFDSGSNFDVADLGGDFSFDNSLDFGDTFDFDNNYFSDASDWLGDFGSSIGNTFSDLGSSFGDFFDFGGGGFGSFFAKDGGLATPMYANGGGVRGYSNGSSVLKSLPSEFSDSGFDPSLYTPEQIEVILKAIESNSYSPTMLAEIKKYDPTRYNANAFNPLYMVSKNSASPTGYSQFGKTVNADGSPYTGTGNKSIYGSGDSFVTDGSGNVVLGNNTTTTGNNTVTNGNNTNTNKTTTFIEDLFNNNITSDQTSNNSTGVDMSQIGVIKPRTTTFGMGPARVVPYSQYGTSAGSTSDYSQLMQSLGAPTLMAEGGSTYYTFGKEVDPIHNLQGELQYGDKLKGGGLPKATTPMTPEGRHDYRQGAYVDGIGDGQSDDIPAMLADGEYVIDSETVSALGNGSNKAGAKVLDQFRHGVRSHKRSAPLDKIPPKAKSPLEYIRMGAKMKGAK